MLISPQNTLPDIPRITFNQISGQPVIQSRRHKISCLWRVSSQGKESEALWFVTLPGSVPVPQPWKQELLLFLTSWQLIFDMTLEPGGAQEIDSLSSLLLFIQIAPSSWYSQASLVAQMVKNLPAMWETWVHSLGQEDTMEKGMAANSSILAWETPWTEEPGGLQSMRLRSRARRRD